ncbi:hypothetical protein ACWEX2_13450 [Staphylococcus xylosus]|uniref:Lipoprotein n=1 Tax=Staphylococcus xylosus TaxID=1288 RepID=A0AAQ0RWL5_STAXY|nr:hypothetical protein [Staphylococcus xylosus]RIM64110.1 hypothetical protein BU122_12270 [Staphylococcus xylosus]RIM90636.1 hypothetical protein BU104_13500 [Staphylococcus xylosus]
MKKVFMGIALLLGVVLVLTACGKTSKDRLQGEWKADNSFAEDSIGTSMKIKNNNIKVNNSDENDDYKVKYFNFKDKEGDEQKHIRFYYDKPSSTSFVKDSPDIEGVLHFKDENTITIETKLDGTYKFIKE